MTYFFVFLLQTVLPTALLLGCNWSRYPNPDIKALVRLTLLGLITGIGLANILPANQTANFILNAFFISALVFFYLCQSINSLRFNKIWHFILISIAALRWAKDPNITAITATDVINTDFILHISAVILGIIFCIFMAAWLFILLRQYKTEKKTTALCFIFTTLLVLLMLLPLCGHLLLSLIKLQILELTKLRLSFVAKSTGVEAYFNYIHAVILLAVMLIFTLHIYLPRKKRMEEEKHPIEKRKKTAVYRHSRNIIAWGGVAWILLTGSQLYWDKVASQPPQLSEAIPVTPNAQHQIRIPIEQVKDGKLHRFVWIADDGKAVRFFIINRLADRLSLGVVFDACLLCGDQGYVMQDDQVVCIGCGVRMFIPSIGKPGGCNPVPIEDWIQTESDVVIHKRNLEEGLNLFSTIVEIQVTDPVDGSQLTNLKTDYKYVYENKTYFFADEKNLERFRDNPDAYLPEDK